MAYRDRSDPHRIGQGDAQLGQGDAHEIMRFVYCIEIINALKPIIHLFELPCLPLTGLDLIFFLP